MNSRNKRAAAMVGDTFTASGKHSGARLAKRSESHRLSLLIGSGLLGGLALAALSPQRWSRVGAALFGASAWLARSPVGPALLGALFARIDAYQNPSVAHSSAATDATDMKS